MSNLYLAQAFMVSMICRCLTFNRHLFTADVRDQLVSIFDDIVHKLDNPDNESDLDYEFLEKVYIEGITFLNVLDFLNNDDLYNMIGIGEERIFPVTGPDMDEDWKPVTRLYGDVVCGNARLG